MKKKITTSFLACAIMLWGSACSLSKKTSSDKNKTPISGLYATDETATDLGYSIRTYLKFFEDGTVLKLSSSLSCDSVNLIISKQYNLKSTYTISNGEISFTFEGTSSTKNKYIEAYAGKILEAELNLVRGLKYYDDQSFTPFNEKYKFCKETVK